jgi:DNA-binding response OmpR family regulator
MPQTLLLVEDSLTIQHVVQRTFVPEGFLVVVAKDGQEGLHTLHSITPDVVLADATMPDMDGFQFCQTLRDWAGFAHVPVVLLTSNFAAYDEARGKRAGVTASLAKPFESDVLLTLVQRVLSQVPTASPGMTHVALAATAAPTVRSTGTVAPRDETAETDESDSASGVTAPPPAAECTAATDAATLAPHILGESLLHTVQAVLREQLHTILESLTPQILAEVRHTVSAQIPDILEVLLQQEIDKLKHAVAHDAEHGEPERGTG